MKPRDLEARNLEEYQTKEDKAQCGGGASMSQIMLARLLPNVNRF